MSSLLDVPYDNNEDTNKAICAQCAVIIPLNPLHSYSSVICSLNKFATKHWQHFFLSRCLIKGAENRVCQKEVAFNSLKAELNPICHLLEFLGAHHIIYVTR
jgi:hypothetical protein